MISHRLLPWGRAMAVHALAWQDDGCSNVPMLHVTGGDARDVERRRTSTSMQPDLDRASAPPTTASSVVVPKELAVVSVNMRQSYHTAAKDRRRHAPRQGTSLEAAWGEKCSWYAVLRRQSSRVDMYV